MRKISILSGTAVFFLASQICSGQVAVPVLWDFTGTGGAQILSNGKVDQGRGGVFVYDETSPGASLIIQSPKRYNLFGVAKSSAGDIDGDGYDDILIGAPMSGPNSQNPGAAYVYSGATGLELLRVKGFGKDNYFGRSVVGAGDINGDDVPDLLVGGWYLSEQSIPYGRVYLLSGTDGKLLRTITSYESGDAFGYTISSLGDLSGDGIPEIGIAAPLADTQDLGTGSVYIIDFAASPFKHITTSNAVDTITNADFGRDYFGSFIAYDDQMSTSSFDAILIGSVDPVSYGADIAQFTFSHHKVGSQVSLGVTNVPAQIDGDVTKDGKTTSSDLDAVITGNGVDLDLNGDGQVTSLDVAIVLGNYGASSPIHSLLDDPSPLLSRMTDLTGPGGMLNVQPTGDTQPWRVACDDGTDDGPDDGPDGGPNGSGGHTQPPFPGIQPWGSGDCGNPLPCLNFPMDPPTTDIGDLAEPDCDDEEDCEEGDPDCDDDGSENCGCELPEGVVDGDCDAFTDTGNARYVGRGMESDEFFASVAGPDWIAYLEVANSSEVGATIVSVSRSGSDYTAVVQFADESGECSLKWVAINTNTDIVYRRCFTVEVVDFEEINFQYRTFITCSAIKTPRFLIGNLFLPPYFGGDVDRYDCNLNSARFSPTPTGAQTHRTSYDTNIGSDGVLSSRTGELIYDCDDELTDFTTGESPDLGRYVRFGLTRAFAASSVTTECGIQGFGNQSCQHALLPGAAPLTNPMPDRREYRELDWSPITYNDVCQMKIIQSRLADGTNGGYPLRVDANKVLFRYYLHASDPLIIFDAAPAIDVYGVVLQMIWDIDPYTGRQKIIWEFSGEIDAFPAHEAYLNGNVLYRLDPHTDGTGVSSLSPLLPNAVILKDGESLL